MPKDFLGEKCLNLWRFIRHSLLEVKVRKEVFEDGKVWKKSQVEVLFKDSVVNCSNREWLRDVHAADYIKHIAEMEAITLYIMEQRNVGYCEAAESMGFVCMTYANEHLLLQKHGKLLLDVLYSQIFFIAIWC